MRARLASGERVPPLTPSQQVARLTPSTERIAPSRPSRVGPGKGFDNRRFKSSTSSRLVPPPCSRPPFLNVNDLS